MADSADTGQKLKILVVDDQAPVRDVTLAMLDALGYDGFGAESGSAALAFLKRERIDALLVDVAMPDLPGTEVVKRMEQLGHEVPVVFVTGMATREEELELSEKPPQRRLLMKPYRMNDLRALLTELDL